MTHRLESCARVCSCRPYECLNFQKYSAAVAAVCCAEFFKCISSKPLCYLTLLNLSFFFCNEMEAKLKVFLMPIHQEWCSLFIDIFSEEFVAHGASVNCVSLGHKSGRVLVTGGDDKKVNLWAVGKPNCIMVRQKPPIIHPSSLNTTTILLTKGRLDLNQKEP